jgi:predicted nucleotidyltransferase
LNDAFEVVEVVSPLERNFKRDAAFATRPVLFGSGPRGEEIRGLSDLRQGLDVRLEPPDRIFEIGQVEQLLYYDAFFWGLRKSV